MEVSICEQFPAYTPTALRKEKAREVFILISRLNKHNRRNNKTGPKGKVQGETIRRPAGDNWF